MRPACSQAVVTLWLRHVFCCAQAPAAGSPMEAPRTSPATATAVEAIDSDRLLQAGVVVDPDSQFPSHELVGIHCNANGEDFRSAFLLDWGTIIASAGQSRPSSVPAQLRPTASDSDSSELKPVQLGCFTLQLDLAGDPRRMVTLPTVHSETVSLDPQDNAWSYMRQIMSPAASGVDTRRSFQILGSLVEESELVNDFVPGAQSSRVYHFLFPAEAAMKRFEEILRSKGGHPQRRKWSPGAWWRVAWEPVRCAALFFSLYFVFASLRVSTFILHRLLKVR